MPGNLKELCRDLNAMGSWLALNETGEVPAAEVDAIVLFGNQVAATLVAACHLAKMSPHAVVLFSGGVGHSTGALLENLRRSGFGGLCALDGAMNESEMYAAVAEQAFGIATGRILLENQSSNAGENARLSLRRLSEAGLGEASVVLLQDPTMLRRAILTWRREARVAGLRSLAYSQAAFVPVVEPGPDGMPRLIEGQRSGTWSIQRYAGLLLGEMERLHDDENGYGPRGRDYIDHVEIPGEVWESYLRVNESPLRALAAR